MHHRGLASLVVMHPVAKTLISAALALVAAIAVAAPASAQNLSCGSTITKSTKLTTDITDCPGVGLRIGADDITLDLNGHTVSAAAKRNPKAHGILNEGYDDVTIRGGTVRGFGAYGVRLAHADRNAVEDMKLDANFTGVGLFESDRGAVRDNVITDAKFVGVNLTGGRANRVVENAIDGSAYSGVFLHGSPDETGAKHRVLRNVLTDNGIAIHPGPKRTRVAGNTISGAGEDSIENYEPSTLIGANAIS
jgi:copper-binding protein NosD